MGVGSCTSKSILGFLGLIFSACAVFLFGAAGYVIATYNTYDQFVAHKFTLVPAICAVIIGIIFFFAAILGCCSMCSENRCILTMFGFWLFVLLGVLVSTTVVTIVYKGQILGAVQNGTDQVLEKYGNESVHNHEVITKQVDYVQNMTDIHQAGCYDQVVKAVEHNAKIIAGSVLGFSILLVLGIICTCVLCCLKRQEQVPYFSLQ